MNNLMAKIRQSNKEHLMGDLKCCDETPDYIFRPAIDVLKHMPSVSILCKLCGKEKSMHLSKTMLFADGDPVLSESIKILKNKWNNES